MHGKLLRKVNLFFSSVLIFLLHIPFVFAKGKPLNSRNTGPAASIHADTLAVPSNPRVDEFSQPKDVYDSLRLGNLGLDRQVFDYAMKGITFMKETGQLFNDNILSIADFSRPSSKKRLYVIDLKNYRLLFNTYVAHGMNSGKEFANYFSNLPESNKSSLGFYITSGTYNGKHGYSLHLEGIERGINDNALSRDIVVHGADYVDEQLIRQQGYIGRSLGCPAVPEKLHKPIIDKIKNGTCLFIFGHDKRYLAQSKIINSNLTSLAASPSRKLSEPREGLKRASII